MFPIKSESQIFSSIKSTIIPEFDIWVCSICGYEYNEQKGIPDADLPLGTKFTDIPDYLVCPNCGASKVNFKGVNKSANFS